MRHSYIARLSSRFCHKDWVLWDGLTEPREPGAPQTEIRSRVSPPKLLLRWRHHEATIEYSTEYIAQQAAMPPFLFCYSGAPPARSLIDYQSSKPRSRHASRRNGLRGAASAALSAGRVRFQARMEPSCRRHRRPAQIWWRRTYGEALTQVERSPGGVLFMI